MNQPTFTTGPLTTQALIAPQAWGIVKHVEPRLGSTGGTLLVGEAKTFQDAQLFAAAPDLYHALQELKDVICGAGLVDDIPVWLIDEMDSALAKAQGETK